MNGVGTLGSRGTEATHSMGLRTARRWWPRSVEEWRHTRPMPNTPDDAPDHEPSIVISGNDALVSAVPFLVGFEPLKSIVVVWITPHNDRVQLTMRVDVPPHPATSAVVKALTDVLSDPVRSISGDAVPFIVVYPESADGDSGVPRFIAPGDLPHANVVASLVQTLGELMRSPVEALCVVGDRGWSYLCANTECCDWCGHQIDESVRLDVQTRFVVSGRAVLPSREVVAAEIAPAAQSEIRRVRTMIAALGAPVGKPRRRPAPLSFALRARCWTSMVSVATSPRTVTLDDRVATLVGLSDVRMRDAFVALAIQHDVGEMLDEMRTIVTVAPRHFVASSATTLALLSYLNGDGARAWIALDRAFADDPTYSLANLVAQAVGKGLPPHPLRELFASFDPDDLRSGRVVIGAA